jgi:hypothetical protein
VNELAIKNLYAFLTAHYDAVIAVHLTAKFSGTYFSSCKAAETISRAYGKPISVIDSKNVSGALGLIVLRIARAIEKGATHDAIVDQAARWVDDTRILVSVKTLKYMVRGGRVSPLKGLLANLLNLNPIVSMDADGNSMVSGKTFSQKVQHEKSHGADQPHQPGQAHLEPYRHACQQPIGGRLVCTTDDSAHRQAPGGCGQHLSGHRRQCRTGRRRCGLHVGLIAYKELPPDTGPYFRKISLIRMMIRLGGDVFINGKEDLNHLTPPNQGVYAPGQSHVEIKRQGL